MFIFIRKNGYYASQKRLCKQPVLRGGIFIAFSKRQFEVKKSPKIQLYQYVRGWLDTGKKFSGLIKKSACLFLPLNIERDQYSLIMANPPFKGNVFQDEISKDLIALCKTKKTELLFMSLFIKMLKVGGRCASIVPDGVLFGSSSAHKALRKELVDNQQLVAVISMPSGVFKPYAGVSTAVVVFTKTDSGGTDNVWFYDMKADGFSLDDKRTPISDNDIPDVIERFNNLDSEKDRKRTEQSFFVPVDEIRSNAYDLSINKYKKTEYVAVEYPPTEEILDELDRLNAEIEKETKELRTLLNK